MVYDIQENKTILKFILSVLPIRYLFTRRKKPTIQPSPKHKKNPISTVSWDFAEHHFPPYKFQLGNMCEHMIPLSTFCWKYSPGYLPSFARNLQCFLWGLPLSVKCGWKITSEIETFRGRGKKGWKLERATQSNKSHLFWKVGFWWFS